MKDTQVQRGEVTAPRRRQQGSGILLSPQLRPAQTAAVSTAHGAPGRGATEGPGGTKRVASGGEHGPKNLRPHFATTGLEQLSDLLRVTQPIKARARSGSFQRGQKSPIGQPVQLCPQ